ncbi:MAG: hypothetical protein AB7I41_04550 [Candidatus Sericytochromatia bacterium]
MQATKPTVSHSTPNFAPSAAPQRKPSVAGTASPAQNVGERIRPGIVDDQKAEMFIQPYPMPKLGCVLPFDFVDKNSPEQLINQTLKQATRPMGGWSNEYALRHLMDKAQNMTPGEIDDLKDAIVKRMSSPNTSQTERDILKDMYSVVDAVAENRPVPRHLIDHPRYEVYPQPRF